MALAFAGALSTDHHAAAQHFLHYGIAEGRSGAPTFDAAWYLAANPDVAAAYGATIYLGAMVHWQVYGRTEGRPGGVAAEPAPWIGEALDDELVAVLVRLPAPSKRSRQLRGGRSSRH